MRESEFQASNGFVSSLQCNGSLPKTNPGILSKIKVRFRRFISCTISKIISYILIISILSWFGINMKNVATGIVAILHGDITGVTLIAESTDVRAIFKEAYQVAIGVDYTWLDHKKKTGYDLHKDFVYIGSGRSITKTPILIKQISDDLEDDCYTELEDGTKEYAKACDEPTTIVSYEEAHEYCQDHFSATIASYEELKDAIGGINPVTDTKINKYKDYPEMTSTLNPNDDDEYRVFYKRIGQKEKLEDSFGIKTKGYIDEDSLISSQVAFRCFIRL